MNTKYILLIVLIIVAYLVYKYWKNSSSIKQDDAANNAHNVGNVLSNTFNSQQGGTTVNNVVVPPIIMPGQYVIGSLVYGGPTGVNSYNTPSPTPSQIDKFWRKDELIGTYLAVDGKGFIKVLTKRSVNSIENLFGYQENIIVWVLANQVYTK